MEVQLNTTIGEIVRLNFQTARLFDKHRIDFCCGGQLSLEEACSKAGANAEHIAREVNAIIQTNDPDAAYIERLPLDRLCDYIVERHHTYVAETVPFLLQKLNKLCDVHGNNHPELFKINNIFQTIAENLAKHMRDEEDQLFPLVKKVLENEKDGISSENELSVIETLIKKMEDEHQSEGERLSNIATFSHNFTAPSDGCNTYRITYQTLAEFEQDLHRHIHLENNVLFKKISL